MDIETGFLLGLASGGACLVTCGPLAAAFLTAEGANLKQCIALLTIFLSGRFLGYCGWAVLAWLLGRAIFQVPSGSTAFSFAGLVLGAWLIYYGISKPVDHSHKSCPGSILKSFSTGLGNYQVLFRGGIWGFLSGLQVCPPFFAAIIGAARTGGLGGSLLFFFLFYLGTGIWFLPFPFVGTLGRFRQVAQVARFCALLLGAYYIYSGLITLTGGSPFHG
ncbi:MAG TPA: sulfite exporter TauE/SafE family protein [Thermodesulfobacteriota bacterium]|nr:sulfite exporter TauE/SafE family protein [Thermodesulfobacteriota bacterium]